MNRFKYSRLTSTSAIAAKALSFTCGASAWLLKPLQRSGVISFASFDKVSLNSSISSIGRIIPLFISSTRQDRNISYLKTLKVKKLRHHWKYSLPRLKRRRTNVHAKIHSIQKCLKKKINNNLNNILTKHVSPHLCLISYWRCTGQGRSSAA